MSSLRAAAVSCLIDIFDRGMKPKQTIEAASPSLADRDRSFLMEIVYGVTRFRDTLDWVLGHFLKNPSRLGTFTRNNLRAAAYQIYFMRVPDWAAVNEAVDLEKGDKGRPSLVNGVLRNIIRQRGRVSLPVNTGKADADMAINTSHPLWMIRRWMTRLGADEAAALAAANNIVAPLVLRTNTLRTTREDLIALFASQGIAARPTHFSPEGVLLETVRSFEAISFSRGLCIVQDEASQLIGHLLGPRPGERILDVCAAPGGKTTHIAQLTGDSGKILALEADGRRIGRLTDNIHILGISNVQVVHADIAEAPDIGTFDRILVDAPCSATGTIRKNPDVKYRHAGKDLPAFASKQSSILREASRRLRPGGTLVYSVCSTEPEEGEAVVRDFLKTEEDFRIIDADALFLKDFFAGGFFRTYPHRHAMDGFFGVKLCKNR